MTTRKTIVITVGNNKGGVAKTTTVRNIAKSLSLCGKRILLVDMDAQGNLTTSCNVKLKPGDPSIAEFLLDNIDAPIRQIGYNEWLIPADIRLSYAGQRLANVKNRSLRLSTLLEGLKDDFDFIIIDTAPSFDVGCFSALRAADFVIITTEAAKLSIDGAVKLAGAVKRVQAVSPSLQIVGVVVTRFERTRSNAEAVKVLDQLFPGKVFETKIRRNTSLAEAPARGMSIFEYAPESTGATAYRALTQEILLRIEDWHD